MPKPSSPDRKVVVSISLSGSVLARLRAFLGPDENLSRFVNSIFKHLLDENDKDDARIAAEASANKQEPNANV